MSGTGGWKDFRGGGKHGPCAKVAGVVVGAVAVAAVVSGTWWAVAGAVAVAVIVAWSLCKVCAS